MYLMLNIFTQKGIPQPMYWTMLHINDDAVKFLQGNERLFLTQLNAMRDEKQSFWKLGWWVIS